MTHLLYLDLVNAIAEQGILVTIAAVFVWFSIKQYRRTDALLKHATDTLIDEQGKRDREHDIRLAARFQTTSMIQSVLKAAQEDCNVDTVFVIEFHNSVMNVAGIPFAKCTVTYEVSTGYIASSILPVIQNLPISIFSGMILDMPRNEAVSYSLQELMTTNSVLYSLLVGSSVQSIYVTKLISGNQVIGLLVATSSMHESKMDLISMPEKLQRHGTTISELICIDKM